jgi:hypothetical protein
MIQPPGGSYAVVQDFGSGTTFTWTGNGIGGTYGLELDAKGATAAPNTMQSLQLSFVLTACSAVTLATSPASPQTPGTSVVLTATATCPGTAQYRFSIAKPNLAYAVVLDYGSANTYSWNTTAQPLGGYGLRAEVRNVGATTAAEASASVTYALANPACTTPTVTSNPASPQGPATVVTFTATTTTCPSPLFRFFYETSPGAGWTLLQDYSASNTYRWSTAGAPGGSYRFEVDVRDSTRPVPYDQYTIATYAINSCAGAALSPSVPSPRTVGTQITVTASAGASFCPNPRYKFWILAPGSSTWQMVQDYSAGATYNWNTAGAATGTYYLGVWVRDAVSNAGSDSSISIPYTLTTPSCASVTAAAAPPTSAASGTQVTFTATASGCTGSALYAFWARWQGYSTWQLLQGYSASNVYKWNSTGAAAGTEYIGVWAKDAGSPTGSFDANASIPYAVTTPSCTNVTATAAPTTVVHGAGTHVIVSASSTCTSPSPRYQFWLRTTNTDWQLVQGYSTSATYDWNSTGAPVTTVYIGVWAKDANSTTSAFDSNISVAIPVT